MAFTAEQRAKGVETRQRNAAARREHAERAPMSAGIGESKVFGGNYTTPEIEADRVKFLKMHVGGMLIGELPEETIARLSLQHTDEYIAEQNKGRTGSGITVTRDEYAGKLLEREDMIINRGAPSSVALDPMRDTMNRCVPTGYRGRFLDPAVIKKRGMRGWEPLIDKDGKQIMVQDQILGIMPVEVANRRNQERIAESQGAVRKVEKRHPGLLNDPRIGA